MMFRVPGTSFAVSPAAQSYSATSYVSHAGMFVAPRSQHLLIRKASPILRRRRLSNKMVWTEPVREAAQLMPMHTERQPAFFTRKFLIASLPPGAFRTVRFAWYCFGFFLRAIGSIFIRRLPEVHAFDRGGSSCLAEQLRAVNTLAPTRACYVMAKYHSDKASRWHNYTTIYSALFNGRRTQIFQILELGLGTNNPELPSTMGAPGRPGASLRGWRELFPHAHVYGADIDTTILFQEDRIKTFHCDQLDEASIRALWSQADFQAGMDIIIEDGLHTFEANISFLEGSLEHLRAGGIYVIEDIATDVVDRWCDRIKMIYSERYAGYDFALVILPNRLNRSDNNLLVIRKS